MQLKYSKERDNSAKSFYSIIVLSTIQYSARGESEHVREDDFNV
jgi:hypothetical protein